MDDVALGLICAAAGFPVGYFSMKAYRHRAHRRGSSAAHRNESFINWVDPVWDRVWNN
jgi:hypothetical protein